MNIRFAELLEGTGLAEEVAALRSLHELASNWDAIRTQAGRIADIEDLLELVGAIAQRNGEVIGALNALQFLDVNTAALEQLAKFLGRLQDQDEDIVKLLSLAGRFQEAGNTNPGLLQLPLLAAAKARQGQQRLAGTAVDLALAGEGDLVLEAEAGDLLPYSGAPGPGRHLRISGKGKLIAGAGATLPFTGGEYGLGLDGKAAANLDYYFQADAGSLYVLELARSIPQLPNPFSYPAVISALRSERLDALTISTTGSLGGKISLAVQQPALLWAPGVPGSLKFSFSAEVRKSAVFDMVLRAERGANGKLAAVRLSLSRSATRERASSSGLTISVDPGELFTGLRDNLALLLGQYQDLVGEYQDYLSPGTWLREQGKSWAGARLSKLISNQPLRDAAAAVFGSFESEEHFGEALSAALTRAADSVTGFFDREVAQVRQRMLARVRETFPVLVLDLLGPKLEQVIDLGIAELRGGLKKRTAALVAQGGQTAQRQIERLAGIGGSVQAAVDKAQTRADKLLEGVRETLSRVEGKLQELHDLTARLAQEKLTVSWNETTQSAEGQRIMFDARLPASGDLKAFDAVYDALVRGSVNEIAELLTRPGVEVISSSLEAFASWKKQTSYAVVFMETLLERGTILDAEARIVRAGENIAVGTKGTLEAWSRSKSQQQTATFLNVVDLAAARASEGAARRNFQFRLGLEHQENTGFRESEVRQFLQEFEDIGAVRAGLTDRALAAMHDANLVGPANLARTRIRLGMSLDEPGLASLLGLGDSLRYPPAGDSLDQRQLYSVALQKLILAGAFDQRFTGPDRLESRRQWAAGCLSVLKTASAWNSADSVQMLMEYHTRPATRIGERQIARGKAKSQLDDGKRVVNMLQKLYDTLSALREVWTSNPVAAGRDEAWYRDRQKAIVIGLDAWMKTGFALVGGWKDGKPQHETVAFCAIIGALAGGGRRPVLLSVSIETEGLDQVIVID